MSKIHLISSIYTRGELSGNDVKCGIPYSGFRFAIRMLQPRPTTGYLYLENFSNKETIHHRFSLCLADELVLIRGTLSGDVFPVIQNAVVA